MGERIKTETNRYKVIRVLSDFPCNEDFIAKDIYMKGNLRSFTGPSVVPQVFDKMNCVILQNPERDHKIVNVYQRVPPDRNGVCIDCHFNKKAVNKNTTICPILNPEAEGI